MLQLRNLAFSYRVMVAWGILIWPLSTADAQIEGPRGENKFCAMYDDGSAMDCTFASYAECQRAISGVGGICQANDLPRGRYMPQVLPQVIPNDPLGLYRDRGNELPPVPPPP